MKNAVGRFVIKLCTVLLFLGVTAVTLFFAYGYRFDVEEQSVEKTSIIDVTNSAQGAQIYLDSQLVSNLMPIQLKGVLPGSHLLDIRKVGFRPWSRIVNVKEDFVTIIEDILLVPEKVEKFMHEAVKFSAEDQIYPGDRYLLAFRPGSQVLSIVELFDAGTYKEEEIGFYRGGLAAVETMPDERFLLHFDDGLSAYVSFSDRIFKTFALKPGAQKMRVDPGRRLVYFLQDGSLYRLGFQTIGESPLEDYAPFEIQKEVSDYDIDQLGNVYMIASGSFLRKGLDGSDLKLLDKSIDAFTNLSVTQEGSEVALVLRSANGTRRLFLTDGTKPWKLLTDGLKGKPFINKEGDFLYADNEGHLFLYRSETDKKIYVTQVFGDFEPIGWFSDRFHFLLIKEGTLMLYDIYGKNVSDLLADYKVDGTFVSGPSLFFLKDKTLQVLSWEEQ